MTTKDVNTQVVEQDQRYLVPAVDIYEEATGITVKADLPGARKEGLDVQIDGNTLTISADLALDVPEGMEALYADVPGSRYQRRFVLSKELDAENIDARIANGVLTLFLPKKASLQPRKIAVKAG